MFATFTYSLSRYLINADPDLLTIYNTPHTPTHPNPFHPATKPLSYDPNRVDKMFDLLLKYEENFTRHLKILLETLNYLAATETVVFLSLCARLSSAGEGVGGFEGVVGVGMM